MNNKESSHRSFIEVICNNCRFKQTIFECSTFPVVCLNCDKSLAKSSSGKCNLINCRENI